VVGGVEGRRRLTLLLMLLMLLVAPAVDGANKGLGDSLGSITMRRNWSDDCA